LPSPQLPKRLALIAISAVAKGYEPALRKQTAAGEYLLSFVGKDEKLGIAIELFRLCFQGALSIYL
jgi:hypothetical protein